MKPRQTDSGKGDFNRSEFSKFQSGYSNINFHTSTIEYYENGDDYWFQGEGWYFSDETWQLIGPFNTWSAARNGLRKYCEELFDEEENPY